MRKRNPTAAAKSDARFARETGHGLYDPFEFEEDVRMLMQEENWTEEQAKLYLEKWHEFFGE